MDVTGIVMTCAKRTVSGDGLSRAALVALVAAGVEVTGCGGPTPHPDYGAPPPPGFMWPDGTGGSAGTAGSGGLNFGISPGGGTGGTGGRATLTGGRIGATDAAIDAPIDVGGDANTDATRAAPDANVPSDSGSKD
jgi:hypothetical protein